jgi:hypothetical protein
MLESNENCSQERSDATATSHSRFGVQQTTSHSRFDLGLKKNLYTTCCTTDVMRAKESDDSQSCSAVMEECYLALTELVLS